MMFRERVGIDKELLYPIDREAGKVIASSNY